MTGRDLGLVHIQDSRRISIPGTSAQRNFAELLAKFSRRPGGAGAIFSNLGG
jgi:hypothetical protein